MSEKRRLRVIDQAGNGEPERPRGHWILATSALAFALWLPLGLLAVWAAQALLAASSATRSDPRAGVGVVVVALLTSSFFLASGLAAALVRRFVPGVSLADSASGGALAGLVSCALAAAAGSLSPWPVAVAGVVVLSVTGATGAAAGAALARAIR